MIMLYLKNIVAFPLTFNCLLTLTAQTLALEDLVNKIREIIDIYLGILGMTMLLQLALS